MKRILVTLLLIASWQFSSAQDASFGIKVGLSSNNVSLKVDSEVTAGNGNQYTIQTGDTKVGFLAGFTSRFSFGSLFLMPELYFSSATNDYQVQNLTLSSVFESKQQTLSKLDIPVLVGYKTGPFRVNAGPIATLILSEKNGLANLLLEGVNGDAGTKDFTFGFQAGIGLDISKLAIDLRYEGNLSKLSDGLTVANNDFNFDTRQRQIILSFGVLF